MGKKTILHDIHAGLGARMVDFGGWDMPVHYGSQIEEHHAVRRVAGMFDVSHMTVVDLEGSRTRDFLERLIANDPGKLRARGKALYTCMLNDAGGVIDDLIVYFRAEDRFRLIVNAATREKDLAWISAQAEAFGVGVLERGELAMIAVQGPEARERAARCLGGAAGEALDLKPFMASQLGEFFVARTGYTGEDGWEIVLPEQRAVAFWNALLDAGIVPCGLGARDTLRLEAGLNLYGNDMDETTTPLESGLAWTVAFEPTEREFIGRRVLDARRSAGVTCKFVGLVLEGKGVIRSGYTLHSDGAGSGRVTSGGFSPTMGRSIGLARVPADWGERCTVDVRGRQLPARIVRPPFVRKGEICVE